MDKRIEALSGHIIVAGLGRVGRQAVHELAEARVQFLVVDPADATVRQAEEHGWHGRPYSLNLTVPPLAALFFVHEPKENSVHA